MQAPPRHLGMGVWTGLLAGTVTALVVLALDLATGAGLDGSARLAAAAGLPPGVPAAALAGAGGGLLFAVALGLVLSLLPPRLAGAGLGLLVGAAAGLGLVAGAVGRLASRDALVLLLSAAVAGVLTGFLYSRYARTQLRSPGFRPFGRR